MKAKFKKLILPDDAKILGRSLADVENSQASRSDLLALFGGKENLPSSVMKAEKGKISKAHDAPVANGRKYTDDSPMATKYRKDYLRNKSAVSNLVASGKGCGAGALSTFPQNIGRSILLMLSKPFDTVFDPFAGHNSRMSLCVQNNRHYIGCDLSTEFMAFNKKRARELRQQKPKLTIELHHTDSRKVPVESDVGDFTISSPPYFDIEEYGDEPQQLGKAKTYEGFLDGLKQVMAENYRCLKRGGTVLGSSMISAARESCIYTMSIQSA